MQGREFGDILICLRLHVADKLGTVLKTVEYYLKERTAVT